MGSMGPSAAIAPVTGTVGLIGGLSEARQINRAAQQSADSARRAALFRRHVAARAAGQQLGENRRRTDDVVASVAMATETAGLGTQGTARDLALDAILAGERREAAIRENLGNENEASLSEFEAQIHSLRSRTTNPALRAIQGGLRGVQAGLSLANGVRSLMDEREQRQEPTP